MREYPANICGNENCVECDENVCDAHGHQGIYEDGAGIKTYTFNATECSGRKPPVLAELKKCFPFECCDEILCPYCGHKQRDADEFIGYNEEGETDCGNCGNRFLWSVHRTETYSTKAKPEKP